MLNYKYFKSYVFSDNTYILGGLLNYVGLLLLKKCKQISQDLNQNQIWKKKQKFKFFCININYDLIE